MHQEKRGRVQDNAPLAELASPFEQVWEILKHLLSVFCPGAVALFRACVGWSGRVPFEQVWEILKHLLSVFGTGAVALFRACVGWAGRVFFERVWKILKHPLLVFCTEVVALYIFAKNVPQVHALISQKLLPRAMLVIYYLVCRTFPSIKFIENFITHEAWAVGVLFVVAIALVIVQVWQYLTPESILYSLVLKPLYGEAVRWVARFTGRQLGVHRYQQQGGVSDVPGNNRDKDRWAPLRALAEKAVVPVVTVLSAHFLFTVKIWVLQERVRGMMPGWLQAYVPEALRDYLTLATLGEYDLPRL